MANPWCRLHADIVDDEKVRALAFEDRWHYVAILALTCDEFFAKDRPDSLLRKLLAVKLGVSADDVDGIKERLVEVDLIDESWHPKGWEKRQYTSDTSTERVRKYRNRKDSSKRNADETLHETQGNVPVTSPDTETDTESEGEDSFGVLSGKPDDQGANEPASLPAKPPDSARSVATAIQERARAVIDDLNRVVGSRFTHSPRNLKFVTARFAEGLTEAQLAEAVRFKAREWAPDPNMAKFLRPETLFGSKCEGYVNAAALARASPASHRLSANGRASVEALQTWAERKRSEGA